MKTRNASKARPRAISLASNIPRCAALYAATSRARTGAEGFSGCAIRHNEIRCPCADRLFVHEGRSSTNLTPNTR